MSDQNLFAPPTEGEIKAAKATAEAQIFAPPSEAEIKAAKKLSPVESAISGLAQGLTLGHSDEIAGAGRAAIAKLGGAEEPFGTLYEKYRDEQRGHQAKAKADNPKTYVGGDLAGAVGTAFLPGVSALAPAKGAGLLANVGKAGLLGAISGAGYSNANPTESPDKLKEFAGDVGTGAAIAGATQGALQLAGKAASKLAPDNLREFANERSIKAATGQNKAILKRIAKTKGLDDTGEVLLNESSVSGPVVKFGSSVNSIKDRAADAAEKAWDSVTGVYKQADQALGGKAIDGREIAQGIIDRAAKIEPLPQNEAIINKMMETAAYLENKGAMSLEHAQQLKNNFVFKMADPKTHALGLDGNNAIREAFTESMGQAIKRVDPALEKAWADSMKLYGTYATAAGAADERAIANVSNRFFSPSDYAMGIGGALLNGAKEGGGTKDSLIGLATTMAHKLVRERGSSMAAVTAKNLAAVLDKTPEALGSAYPVLQEAAKAGPAALEAAHEMLMNKDAAYRRLLQPRPPGDMPIAPGNAIDRRIRRTGE